ncbi:MAG: hypothetical protein LUH43_07410, partial [Clostridia bacterium]|nr:hypothetical protein [Clostridia bacterium]
WRFVSKSNMSSREMTSFTVDTCTMFAKESKTPTINPTPSNAYWTQAYDFSYSGYDSSKIDVAIATGKFTSISSSTSLYSATITATHRVTGLTATFSVVVNPYAALFGIKTSSGIHFHKSWLSPSETCLLNMGFSDVSAFYTSYSSKSTVLAYLKNDNYNVFAIRAHGGSNDTNTWVILSDSDAETTISLHSTDFTFDLSNMKLLLFVGCSTGYGGTDGKNLPVAAVESGAATAIGFEGTIICYYATEWTKDFFEYLEQGNTVKSICEELAGISSYQKNGLADYVLCGKGSTSF